jgi:hypothetical protein
MTKHTVRDPDTGERRREFNTEFIDRFMNYGSPLRQGFVLSGLRYYAEKVLDASIDELGGENAFVNPHALKACAQEYLDELKEHQA